MSEQNKRLCLDLLYSESEDEVIHHLKAAGYWDDPSVWRFYGDNENNWDRIGNQQSSPVPAVIEKLVNSIDAVLMRECLIRGIDPEGRDAPKSINAALSDFFDIKYGDLARLDRQERSALSHDIGFVATGRKSKPNYTVFDRGEGQTPQAMPKTLLSLSRTNKLRVPFVQGKFNMGGTGVLPFCGSQNFQLVISRRCPQIPNEGDKTWCDWGFTIVRRQDPAAGARSTVFAYLAPVKAILRFSADELVLPFGKQKNEKHAPKLAWGTIIKIYEYKMGGLSTSIKFDLSYAMSPRLPKPGLPIRFFEFRDYVQDSPEQVMSGMLVRLKENHASHIEAGFPTFHTMKVQGERMNVSVYAFKSGVDDKRFRSSDGVIFSLNGQAHGAFSKRFFARNSVRMGYIADSILVLVDATNMTERNREDLTMNSRDRLRSGELLTAIENELATILSKNKRLRALREKRRREAIADQLTDSKPMREVLQKIINQSRVLTVLFLEGKDLTDPYRSIHAREKETSFKGAKSPSYFDLMPKFLRHNERPLNRSRFRFQYETDVVDDYFIRDEHSGTFLLLCNEEEVRDFELNLLDGVATLNVARPVSAGVGDVLHYRSIVDKDIRAEPFEDEFKVTVTDPVKDDGSNQGKRKKAVDDGKGDRKNPGGSEMPNMIEVRKADWSKHRMNKSSALEVRAGDDSSYDYLINMDNVSLLNELKMLPVGEDPELVQAKYKYALVLIGMMILKDMINDGETAGEEAMTPPRCR